ncbi:MAG: hypothetical protein RR728_05025, partial [Oscillospiraceae bacterium]
MVVLIPAFLIMAYIIINNLIGGTVKALILTFLSFTFITVVLAEGLSLFGLYSYVYLVSAWLIIVAAAAWYTYKKTNYCLVAKNMTGGIIGFCRENIFIVLPCLVIVGLALIRGAFYPPQNVDSLMYHLSRAFFYYKNEAVRNFPSSYAWSDYTGPLNAIFMAQLLIFLKGKDYLHNFIQFIPWIVSALAVYGISKNVGMGNKWAVFCAVISFTLSEVVLQAATTQCDLLMASYCVMAVYLMSEIAANPQEHTLINFTYLGIAGGAAMASKVSAGMVLLPFLLIFVTAYLIYLYKSKNIKSVGYMFLAGASAVVIPLGYWIRTGIDLNGDFLAISYSSGMSAVQGGGMVSTMLGRLIVNLGYLLGGSHLAWSKVVDQAIHILYKLVGASEINIDEFTSFTQWVSHDEQPYAIAFSLIIIAIIFVTVVTIKKKNIKLLGYLGAGVTSLTLMALSISAGITSIARYELAPIMLLIPLIGVMGESLSEGIKIKELSYALYYFAITAAMAMGILTSIADCKQTPIIAWTPQKYETLRNRAYFGRGYDEAADEYFAIAQKENITEIGFMETQVSGYYPALYKFGDKKYTTKSIYGTVGMSHLDKNFV